MIQKIRSNISTILRATIVGGILIYIYVLAMQHLQTVIEQAEIDPTSINAPIPLKTLFTLVVIMIIVVVFIPEKKEMEP